MKVIKIGAIWCPGCLIMRPRWQDIEKEINLDSVYLDYDDDKEEVLKYNVGKILPVFIFLDNNGIELTRLIGEVSKKKILETIEECKDR
jgi:thiol-disulfide isomerase/thioredoxin